MSDVTSPGPVPVTPLGDDEPMTAEEAARLLAAVDEHERKTTATTNSFGHARVLLGARVAYVPPLFGQSLPDFLRRTATEIERLLDWTALADIEGVSHLTVDWEMDEGWSSCLVIE